MQTHADKSYFNKLLDKDRGYQQCSRYNDNPQATLFMRKKILRKGGDHGFSVPSSVSESSVEIK